jgi:hypothetical protein
MANLHSDLAPYNARIDKLMRDYQRLESERHTLIDNWEKGLAASRKKASLVPDGFEAKVALVEAGG